MADETPITPSQLGTKTYWDDVYEREYTNFQDTKDVGEVWFGYDSVERLLRWMDKSDLVSKESSIIDLGCGNGFTLVELAKRQYTRLTGVDYSAKAIDLAKALSKTEGLDIKYETCDLLEEPLNAQYDICLDKGTFDAISLNPVSPAIQMQKYIKSVCVMLPPSGILLITSCNWTEDELKAQFAAEFEYLEKIPSPTFQFGGVQGNRETVLVFRKRCS